MSELYSRIFVKAAVTHAELIEAVARISGGDVDGWTVVSSQCEMDVRPNDEVPADHASADAGEFLFFPFTVEVVADSSQCEFDEYIKVVSDTMTSLHQLSMEVVVACDWEDKLPGGGRLGGVA